MKKQMILWLCACVLILFGCQAEDSTTISLKSAVLSCDQEEITTTETAEITYKIDPESVRLDEDCFYANGGEITLQDNSILFQSKEAGTYEIFLSKDDIKSNTITIQVIEKDSAADLTKPSISDEAKDVEAQEVVPQNAPSNLDYFFENAQAYLDTSVPVWVQGDLPQAQIADEDGTMQTILYNDDHTRYVILKGEVDIGSCRAAVSGLLSKDANGHYVIDVDTIQQIK